MWYLEGFSVYGVSEIIKNDHSSESYWAVLSCGIFHYTDKYAAEDGFNDAH